MADLGIVFHSPLVRALIAGEKRQTRRLLAPGNLKLPRGDLDNFKMITPSLEYFESALAEAADFRIIDGGVPVWSAKAAEYQVADRTQWIGRLAYHVGDRLWVREAVTRVGDDGVAYLADGELIPDANWAWKPRTLSSRYMPKGLSRMWLDVTGLDIQRLHDITDADIWDECNIDQWAADYLDAKHGKGEGGKFRSIRAAWECLWDGLHDKPGERWADNPWVIKIAFDVRKGNILSA